MGLLPNAFNGKSEMKNTVKLLIALSYIVFMQSAAALAAHGEKEPHWHYPDATEAGGQSSWSLTVDETHDPTPLNYPYAECGVGAKQSPIDITPEIVRATTSLAKMNIQYAPTPLSIQNNGHTIVVLDDIKSPGRLHFGSTAPHQEYLLSQYHFHTPSEHTRKGKSYPLEIHFVHYTPDGKFAVLGVMVSEGEFNDELQKIIDNLPFNPDKKIYEHPEVIVDANKLLPENLSRYLTYSGSLTTPPCTEGVSWFLLYDFMHASASQIKALQNVMGENARSTNKIHKRIVNTN
jgi:carbonic anhydrase